MRTPIISLIVMLLILSLPARSSPASERSLYEQAEKHFAQKSCKKP